MSRESRVGNKCGEDRGGENIHHLTSNMIFITLSSVTSVMVSVIKLSSCINYYSAITQLSRQDEVTHQSVTRFEQQTPDLFLPADSRHQL